jgi:hypothetical protein
MTHEEKIKYMGYAAGLCGYHFKPDGLDLLVSLYELVLQKEGETTLKDALDIQADVKKRDDIKVQVQAVKDIIPDPTTPPAEPTVEG